MEKIIGPYKKPKAAFHPYDPRAPEVAGRLKGIIEAHNSEVTIEHIGSTAIPGCAGKGVIDLIALYPTDHPDVAVGVLSKLGFQRQGREFRNRFPDERPVMMGTYDYDGKSFLVYVHVIRENAREAVRFRIFRDRLRDDVLLRSEYMAVKKRIISEGITDTDDYVEMKRSVIRRILGADYDE